MSSSTPSDADIVFARANVALARSQRLIASWLPPKTDHELGITKTDEEIEREEQEIFTPVPELLGLGATPPPAVKDGDYRRQELGSNDKLRKQLLSKELARKYGHGKSQDREAGHLGTQHSGSKPRPQAHLQAQRVAEDEEDDDDGGRSSLGTSKRKRREDNSLRNGNGRHNEIDRHDGEEDFNWENDRPKKQAKSYLDEALEQKSRKKKKKKKNKHNGKDDASLPGP